jgi:hypothetical protein
MSKLKLISLPIFILLALVLSTSSCFLNKDKDSKKGGGGGSEFIKTSIFFDRIGEGDTARLKFKLKKGAYCRLELYSQEKGVEPTIKTPKKVPCSNEGDKKKEFVEVIKELRTDTLYFVKIELLSKPDKEKAYMHITVKESGGASDSRDKDGKYKEMFVARLNQPLRTAEFHRHVFKSASSTEKIKQSITRKIGCKAGISKTAGTFSKPDKKFELNNFATTNYGSGKAAAHTDSKGTKRVEFKALNKGIDRWSFLYDKDGADYEVKALPGNTIETIELKSGNTLTFEDPKLEENSEQEPLDVNGGQPFSLEWETDRKLSTTNPTYMILQIGISGSNNSMTCIFDAKKGRGEIPSNLISELPSGTYDVLVELESSQIWAKDGWLVTAYDWRSAQISVQ